VCGNENARTEIPPPHNREWPALLQVPSTNTPRGRCFSAMTVVCSLLVATELGRLFLQDCQSAEKNHESSAMSFVINAFGNSHVCVHLKTGSKTLARERSTASWSAIEVSC
jgi:hypothetical protein